MSPRPRSLPTAWHFLALAILSATLGTALGIAAAGDSVLPGDLAIAKAVQGALPAPLEALDRLGHVLGSTIGGGIILGTAIIIAIARRATPEIALLILASALRLLTGSLKPLFDSPRPTDDLVTVSGTFHGTGYPSGHAQTGAVIGLAFAIIAWRRTPERRLTIAAVVLALVTGLMIGWSRVALGAHWPSDVVGGFLFGTAIVALAAVVLPIFDNREEGSR